MGKPTGFIEYLRELPVDRPPNERVRDWNEFHHHMEEKRLRNQAARCMDCGVPFCHTGKLISGMASGCPINNVIPEWNDLIYRGLWREAIYRWERAVEIDPSYAAAYNDLAIGYEHEGEFGSDGAASSSRIPQPTAREGDCEVHSRR